MKKTKSHKSKKFRFLLDSAFARTLKFPKLAKKANIAHGVYDLGLSRGADDSEIYKKATQEDRFVLTVNLKDFKKLVKVGKAGVIAIDSQMTNQQVEEVVSKFISGKNPDDFKGKATKI